MKHFRFNKHHWVWRVLLRSLVLHRLLYATVHCVYTGGESVYPDTGYTETIIAASMTKRQRLSVYPINRQLQHAEGRQWKTTGLTTFDVEYQGQIARVEALVLPMLEDRVFLGWATLRDLISGPNRGLIHFDNHSATPNTKLRHDILESTRSQQHADTIRLKEFIRRQKYMPAKPCGGCG